MFNSMTAANVSRSGRKLRVLHLAAMLNSGGAERWLVDVCPAGQAENLDMDIVVLYETNGLYAKAASKRGISVFYCPGAGKPATFLRNFRRLLKQNGPYDAIHCHIHAFSGFAALAAWMEGIPVRVVHSHNVIQNSARSLARRGYIEAARLLIRGFATAGLAPSSAAAEDLFGGQWMRDPRWQVLPCGIDLSPFRAPIPPECSRGAFGIPPDALVLGSVGRLTAEKNSEFLVDVLAAVLRRGVNAYLLLVGEGNLRDRLESIARQGGFQDRLLLVGTRSDVPALLRSIVDVFVFPSPPPPRGNEALAIAVVEAQIAGVPTIISDGIPDEGVIVPRLVRRVAADAGADRWAEAVTTQVKRRETDLAEGALAEIERSSFNIAVNIKSLAALYRNAPVATN